MTENIQKFEENVPVCDSPSESSDDSAVEIAPKLKRQIDRYLQDRLKSRGRSKNGRDEIILTKSEHNTRNVSDCVRLDSPIPS